MSNYAGWFSNGKTFNGNRIIDGNIGPQGDKGDKGDRGYSAYEVAVQNGYQGTEEEWTNEFLSPDGYYNKTIVDNKISSEAITRANTDSNLQSQINSLASGSPKGSYATTSALISANPDTGVYVITADGHIYSWTKGAINAIDLGVYQAVEVESDSIHAVNVSKRTFDINNFIALSYATTPSVLNFGNGGINNDGSPNNDTTKEKRSSFIEPRGGQKTIFVGVKISNGYSYRIFNYSTATMSADNLVEKTDFTTENADYELKLNSNDYTWSNAFKIVVKKTNGDDITGTEANNALTVYLFDKKYVAPSELSTFKKINSVTELNLKETTSSGNYIVISSSIFLKAGSKIKFKETTNVNIWRAWLSKRIYNTQPSIDPNYTLESVISSPALNNTKNFITYEDGFLNILLRKTDGTSYGDLTNFIDEFNEAVDLSEAYTLFDNQYNINMINPNNIILNKYINTSGGINSGTSPTGYDSCIFIPANENKAFLLSGLPAIENDNNVIFFDSNGDFISYNRSRYGFNHGITPQNTKYVGVNLRQSDILKTQFMFFNTNIDNFTSITEHKKYRLFWDTPQCKFIAHRGYYKETPEASVPAFVAAGEAGFWGVKVDLCETSDHHWVVSHDKTIDRLFNGTGTINQMTLAELKTYTQINAGLGTNIDLYPNLKIMTLEEALDILKKYNMYLIFEMKSPRNYTTSIDGLLDIIKKYGFYWNCACQQSTDNQGGLYYLRSKSSIIPICWWTGDDENLFDSYITKCKELGNAVYVVDTVGKDTTDVNVPIYANLVRQNNMPFYGASVLTRVDRIKKWIEDFGLDAIVSGKVAPADILESEVE